MVYFGCKIQTLSTWLTDTSSRLGLTCTLSAISSSAFIEGVMTGLKERGNIAKINLEYICCIARVRVCNLTGRKALSAL